MVQISAARLAGSLGGLVEERPPRYAALAARIRLLITDGRLAVGVRLPAERELAAALQLSRATVTAAYHRLRDDGWATACQGAGPGRHYLWAHPLARGCLRRPPPG